jgi:hypothetical protein
MGTIKNRVETKIGFLGFILLFSNIMNTSSCLAQTTEVSSLKNSDIVPIVNQETWTAGYSDGQNSYVLAPVDDAAIAGSVNRVFSADHVISTYDQRNELTSVTTTGSKTLGASDSRIVQTNRGASADISYVLPECSSSFVGQRWPIRTVSETYQITVYPYTSQTWNNISGATTGQGMVLPTAAHARAIASCVQLDDGSYAPIFEHDGTANLEVQ